MWFFRFRPFFKIKDSSLKKKIKILIFTKRTNNFCQTFWVYRTFLTQQSDTIGFYQKILRKKKKSIYFFLRYNTDYKKNCSLKSNWIISCWLWKVTSKSIQWFSSYNQRNKLTKWVIIFWNFTNVIYCFCCYIIKPADRPQKCIVISNLKYTVYRNKSLSN